MNVKGGISLLCMVICLTLIGGYLGANENPVYIMPIWFFGGLFVAFGIWTLSDW